MRKNYERLVKRYLQGDTQAFDEIYEDAHKFVYFAALYILRDRYLAEDIVQDTFLTAFQNLDRYNGGSLVGWLTAIARNKAINLYRRRRRETLINYDASESLYGVYRNNDVPLVYLLAREVLAEDEYMILMMCHVAGYKRREVAEVLKMPIGTVTWKNNVALKKLRERLQKEGIYE